MKITYTPNPLNSIIELDDQEKQLLRLKIKLAEYEDRMYDAHFYLLDPKFRDLDKVAKSVDPDYWCEDEEGKTDHSKLDTRVDTLLEHYIEELKMSHVGDCTSMACSCSKCHAETLIGIDTTKGLNKTSGYYLSSAFSYKEGDVWKERTPTEALDLLKAGTSVHHQHAYAWLLNYTGEHS